MAHKSYPAPSPGTRQAEHTYRNGIVPEFFEVTDRGSVYILVDQEFHAAADLT